MMMTANEKKIPNSSIMLNASMMTWVLYQQWWFSFHISWVINKNHELQARPIETSMQRMQLDTKVELQVYMSSMSSPMCHSLYWQVPGRNKLCQNGNDQKEVCQNPMVIPSPCGLEQKGHLGLLMPIQLYIQQVGIPFLISQNPGDYFNMPLNNIFLINKEKWWLNTKHWKCL